MANEYAVNSSDLSMVADAIREKGGTTDNLVFPDGFISAIENIEEGIDTSDATATSEDILLNETAYVNGEKITGTMPNKGATNGVISYRDVQYTIPKGYHNGSGKVGISATEKAKIIAANIKSGVKILGVTGTLEESISKPEQTTTITPTKQVQTVTPESGYVFSEVTVNAIPDIYIDTSDATAISDDVLLNKTAYINGTKVVGTMPNNGNVTGTILTKTETYTVPKGYHNGSGKVGISSTEQDKIISDNIKKGVTILGVAGKNTVVDTETAAGGISAGKVMDGYVGYVNGNKITGTVADYSWGENITGSPKNLTYVSNEDGYATFRVANTGLYSNDSSATRLRFNLEEQGVVAENIVSGKTVLGVGGTASSGITRVSGSSTSTINSNGAIATLGTFSFLPKYILLSLQGNGMWGELNSDQSGYVFHASNGSYSGYFTTDGSNYTITNVYTPWLQGYSVSYIAYSE